VGSPMAEIFHGEDRRAFRAFLLKVRAEGETTEEEFRVHPQGLAPFWAAFHVGIARDPEGRPGRIRWLFRDITAHREAHDEALEKARYDGISRLVRGLSHEARNALQVSLSGLEMMALELKDSPDALDLIVHVRKSQEYIQYLLEKVRELSAPISLEYRTACVGEILEEAWCHLGPARRDREAEILGAQSPSSFDVRCKVDRASLEKAFRYLLENFLEMAPGAVRVQASWSKGDLGGHPALVIALTEGSLDPPAEVRESFFEPFRKNRAGKACFGPAIARRIVEGHGGTVVLAESPGAGLTVLITIPLVPVKGTRAKPFVQRVEGFQERLQALREQSLDARGHLRRPGEAG
jgi:two-component system, LuxR family, sensor kinase FixL